MVIQRDIETVKFMSKQTYDIAIIGGGHNGLTTACYLAKAGLKVIVVEKHDYVGGAAVSRELYPGGLIQIVHMFVVCLDLKYLEI